MPHKKNNPQKNSPNESGTGTTPERKLSKTVPPKSSPRKAVNLFMVVVLLMIVGGIYLYQKGYITKYYPLVKTKFAGQSPLDATVDIPQEASINFPETLAGKTNNSQEPNSSATPSENINVKNFEKNTPLKDLQERVQHLEKAILTLSLSPPIPQGGSSETTAPADNRLLYAFNALYDLQVRLHQGLPFSSELSAIKSLVSLEDYTILEEYADFGVPNLPYLIKHFKEVGRLLKQEEAFKKSTTFLERAWAVLGQLVHVEKVNGEKNNANAQETHDPDILKSYKARLQNGDVESVITDIKALQNKEGKVTLWLSHAKAYHNTHTIIRKTKNALFQPNP